MQKEFMIGHTTLSWMIRAVFRRKSGRRSCSGCPTPCIRACFWRKKREKRMKVLKRLTEFITFIASLCCLSGIDAQLWQAVPGLLLLGLFVAEMAAWEDGVCEEW